MNNIPTAEEFANNLYQEYPVPEYVHVLMVEFARLHVQAALKAANNKVNYAMEEFGAVFPDTVLNVYPLNNII